MTSRWPRWTDDMYYTYLGPCEYLFRLSSDEEETLWLLVRESERKD
jgi:hypothetical protein